MIVLCMVFTVSLLTAGEVIAAQGETTRVSVDSAGVEGNSYSYGPSISSDGRYVAFWSQASNLVPNDTNGAADVFVHDRQTGQTTMVSVDSAGVEGNSYSYGPSISSDGRYVAFESEASNLVPNDTNGTRDVFVHEQCATLSISIDIEPDHINPKSKGKIQVAILSTNEFDAAEVVDIDSLKFGRTGTEDSLASCDRKPKNVNHDKRKDLVCHFYTQKTDFKCGDTVGILKGRTMEGTDIEGSDSVKIAPCR